MRMINKILLTGVLIVLLSIPVQATEKAAEESKPVSQEIAMLTLEATVESIDHKARKVTLKNDEGEINTFTLDEDAGRLDAVEVGDMLTIKYLSAVTIQVLGPNDAKVVSESDAIVAETQPGEKPGALAATETSIVVTIETIDLENGQVTIKGEDGELETVAARHPENLKKVKVGDRVMITYTEAIGFSVTEKPGTK